MEQKKMRQPKRGTSTWKQSKKCQGHRQLERDECHHGSSGIAVVKVDREFQQGHTIKGIVVGMSKPIQKGNGFIQQRRGSARGMSTRHNATACRGSASSSSAGHDRQ